MINWLIEVYRGIGCYFQLVGTAFMLALGITFHIGNIQGADYGIRAAMCALAAAGTLFLALMPDTPGANGIIAKFVVRLVGAILAFFTAWNWILQENGGDPFPFLWPAIFLFVVFVMLVIFALLLALATQPPRAGPHQ